MWGKGTSSSPFPIRVPFSQSSILPASFLPHSRPGNGNDGASGR